MAVALLAALKAIPFDLYEAAAVDGASAWQRFLHVTLPLLRNTAVVISLLLGILAFYSFDLVWIITDKGGPLNATTLIGVYLFRSFFERKDFSYAAVHRHDDAADLDRHVGRLPARLRWRRAD